jgi:hypothetical protein
MGSFLLRVFGHKAAHKVMERHTKRGGLFDVKYGFSLFRDPSVAMTSKVAAIGIGVGVTMLLMAVEAPLELILGLFIPFVGVGVDVAIDGLEVILFPMLVASLVLPRLVRQPSYVRVSAPQSRYQGEVIDMPPPMLD